jgi:serine/threonine protein kinase
MFVRSNEVLGTGAQATVYSGVSVSDGTPVAIKIFNRSQKNKVGLIRRECINCEHMMKYDIDGVVRYLSIVQDEDNDQYEVVMERLEGKELLDRIIGAGRFSEVN